MKIRIDTPIARLSADLPEDRVKDLLRIALEYATGGAIPVQRPVEAAQPVSPAPRVFTPRQETKSKESAAVPGYKGFLYIKCEGCGKIKGFCVKAPLREHRCDCGHTTRLKDLKPLYVKCKCGESFDYMTNLIENVVTIDCLKCGAPVDLEYHEKNNKYTTIGR